MNRRPSTRTTLLIAGLLTLIAAPALSMQEEVDRLDLCDLADTVVIAEATSHEVVWAEGDEGGILTRAWFAPVMTVRGDVPDTIELLLPGGELSGVHYEVEDVPKEPDTDKRYLLFLRSTGDGAFVVVGGEAGAVRLADPGETKGERYIEAVASVGACHE